MAKRDGRDPKGGSRIGDAAGQQAPIHPGRTEPVEMGGVLIHPGSRIGSYVFIREVGSGGMAKVLLARDPGGDLVALKVLRRNRFKTGLHRFRREFRAGSGAGSTTPT